MFLSNHIAASSPAPDDDFWYGPAGMTTASGARVSSESAMRLSAVYACVKVLAETVAQLPLHLYMRKGDREKEKARKHPLYKVLHSRPNRWQTSFEWREMMIGHCALRGNAFSEIKFLPNGAVGELVPIHPDAVKIQHIGGDYRYAINLPDGGSRTILRSEMLHLRGLSFDGILGMNPIEVERETVGMSLAAREYGARFYRNGAAPGGWIEHPTNFATKEKREDFRSAWQASQTGGNRHKTAVLEYGMKYHPLDIKHTDAQYIETMKYNDTDIARIFRMPPHKIGILDRATFSNIEHQGLEFVVDTMLPWLTRFEQAIAMSLIVNEDRFFAAFSVDGLLRGDAKARSSFYHFGITDGWLTRNEARELENMNPIDGLDRPLEALNMGRVDDTPDAGADEEGDDDQEDDAADGAGPVRRASARDRLSMNAAQRIVNRECQSVHFARQKNISQPDQFCEWASGFYVKLRDQLAKQIGEAAAREYTDQSLDELMRASAEEVESGRSAVADLLGIWKATKAATLAE